MAQTTKVELYGIIRNNTEAYEVFQVLADTPYFFHLKSLDTKQVGTCKVFLECTASDSINPISVKEAIDIIVTLLQDSSNFEEVIFSVYPNLDENIIYEFSLDVTLNGIPLGPIFKGTTAKKLCAEWQRLNNLRHSLKLLPKKIIEQLLA